MTLQLIPDVEKVVSDFLRQHPSIQALDARVVGKTPRRTDTPWIRVVRLDGNAETTSQVEHLIDFMLQIDCYARKEEMGESSQPEANLLGRTARAVLHEMPAAAHDGAVVTSVRIVGDARIPDQDFEPARERVTLTAIVHIHGVS